MIPFDDDNSDYPQAIDLDRDDDDYTIDCPACGEEIPEDVPRCPYCNHWVLYDSPASQRARGWFWPLMIAILIAVILVIWHGAR